MPIVPEVRFSVTKIDVFFLTEEREESQSVNQSSPTQCNILPGVALEQGCEEWRLPVSATPGRIPRRFNQGRGKGHSASHGQHSRPPSFPHESHWELHVRRSVSCFGVCQHLHSLHGLLDTSSAGLNRENNELPEDASSGYVVSLSRRACNKTAPSWVCCVRVGLAIATEGTAQCDVHSQLHSAVARQPLGKDFDVSRILGWNVDIHVTEKRILSDTRPCLAKDTCCHALGGSLLFTRPLLAHEPRWWPNMSRGAWHPSHVASVIWSGNRNLSSQRPEEVGWNGELGCRWASATPAFLPECDRR